MELWEYLPGVLELDVAGLLEFEDGCDPEVMVSWPPCSLSFPPRRSTYSDPIQP